MFFPLAAVTALIIHSDGEKKEMRDVGGWKKGGGTEKRPGEKNDNDKT